jgi:hydrogenase/urease accessory protein HupE
MRILPPLLFFCLCFGPAGLAHEVRPAYFELKERAPGVFDAVWKVPARNGVPLAGDEIPHPPDPAPADQTPRPAMPCGCPAPTAVDLLMGVLPIHPSLPAHARIVSPPWTERLHGAQVKRWTVSLGEQGLAGQEIRIHGLEAFMADTLVRIAFADGRVVSEMLRPDSPAFVVNREVDNGSIALQYLTLGVEHILLGIDHLLFVLGLLLIVRGAGRLVKTITAFTVAHSITLVLATLGWVHIPGPPVEAVIALSIVFVAREALQRREGAPGLTERQPWLVAFAFGLLHGFGFAGALSEVGLPRDEIPAALLFFNLGVEAGQLIFVLAVCGALALAKRLGNARPPAVAAPAWPRRVVPYAIGGLAMFWVIERTSSFLTP